MALWGYRRKGRWVYLGQSCAEIVQTHGLIGDTTQERMEEHGSFHRLRPLQVEAWENWDTYGFLHHGQIDEMILGAGPYRTPQIAARSACSLVASLLPEPQRSRGLRLVMTIRQREDGRFVYVRLAKVNAWLEKRGYQLATFALLIERQPVRYFMGEGNYS